MIARKNIRAKKNLLPGSLCIILLLATFLFPAVQTSLAQDKALSPSIHQALKDNDFISVIVRLEETDDREYTPSARPAQQESRNKLVQSLKESARVTESKLKPIIEEELAKGTIRSYESLWAVNGFSVEANSAGVKRIAELPQVAGIKLDRSFDLSYPAGLKETEKQQPDLIHEAGAGEIDVDLDEEEAEEAEEAAAKKRLPWNLELINVPAAWKQGFFGDDVVIAIMDTGVDPGHPAVQDQYRGNLPGHGHETSWFDATGEMDDGSQPRDKTGHGTHVAGIILGGTRDNPLGVAPGAHWMGANIFTRGHAWESHIIKAFQWLMAPGGDPEKAPDIINCSWATRPEFATDDLQWELLHNVEKAGILVLFAAGNNADEGPGSPAAYPHAFSVGAVTRNQENDETIEAARFSSRGPVKWEGIQYLKPELVAPGTGIYSAWLNQGYNTLDGTSMATAHVAGTSALLLQSRPDLKPAEARHILQQTARWHASWEEQHDRPSNVYGYGLVDALAAVQYDRPLPEPEEIFQDKAEDGMDNWKTTTNNPWNTTKEKSREESYTFADSPREEYPAMSESWLALKKPIALCGYHSPELHMDHAYNFSTGQQNEDDYGYIELSTDGRNWSRVYRFSGSSEEFESFSVPLHLPDDTRQIYLRFRLESNNNSTGQGWYIDNVRLSALPQPLEELDRFRLSEKEIRLGVKGTANVTGKAAFGQDLTRDIEPGKITWHSDDPAIASVSRGEITAQSPGETVITGKFAGKKAELEISVVEITPPEPDPEPRRYINEVEVQLTPSLSGSKIHYTLDGSEPDRESPEYKEGEPILLEESTTIKTRAYLDDVPGPVAAYKYNIKEGTEVKGLVSLQGRSRVDDHLELFFLDEAGYRHDDFSISQDGSFSLQLPLGDNILVANRKLYLLKTREVNITRVNEPVELTELELLAGDITGNNRVGVEDLARLSLAYSSRKESDHWDPLADLNGDGIINILDLRLLSQNYGLVGDSYQ